MRSMGSGHSRPMWRILDRAKPASGGIIPRGRCHPMNPATRQRPALRRSEVRSVTNPRISARSTVANCWECPEPMDLKNWEI